jgi:hypothetical protein
MIYRNIEYCDRLAFLTHSFSDVPSDSMGPLPRAPENPSSTR